MHIFISVKRISLTKRLLCFISSNSGSSKSCPQKIAFNLVYLPSTFILTNAILPTQGACRIITTTVKENNFLPRYKVWAS